MKGSDSPVLAAHETLVPLDALQQGITHVECLRVRAIWLYHYQAGALLTDQAQQVVVLVNEDAVVNLDHDPSIGMARELRVGIHAIWMFINHGQRLLLHIDDCRPRKAAFAYRGHDESPSSRVQGIKRTPDDRFFRQFKAVVTLKSLCRDTPQLSPHQVVKPLPIRADDGRGSVFFVCNLADRKSLDVRQPKSLRAMQWQPARKNKTLPVRCADVR